MKTQTGSAASKAKRILLVDDVPSGTVARKSTLMELGYEVETAENGERALELISAQTFDCVVTDFKMPGMDGLELIRLMKASGCLARIVLLSARAEAFGFTEESTGADAVLAKSATELSQLTRTVKKLLTAKPGRKPAASEKANLRFMVKSS